MTPLVLFAHDPDEEFDDRPTSLLPLADWLAADREGSAPYAFDRHEGTGLWLRDGAHELALPSWGDPRSLGANCAHAADRLAEGRLALIRTAILDRGSYLLLVPEGDVVRVVLPTEPGGGPPERPFPFRPNRQRSTEADAAALYAWAEAAAPGLLAPSGNAAFDRARGKLLRLPREALIAALRDQGRVALALADHLGVGTFPH